MDKPELPDTRELCCPTFNKGEGERQKHEVPSQPACPCGPGARGSTLLASLSQQGRSWDPGPCFSDIFTHEG